MRHRWLALLIAASGFSLPLAAQDEAPADPDAFRITGRTGHLLGDFREIVQPLRLPLGLLRGLLLCLVALVGLGHGRGEADKHGKAEGGQGLQKTGRHDGGILSRAGRGVGC